MGTSQGFWCNIQQPLPIVLFSMITFTAVLQKIILSLIGINFGKQTGLLIEELLQPKH